MPILIGWLRLVGETLHLYSLETGVALVAVFTTVAIVALIWWAAKSLEDTDSARRSAESQVRTLSDQLRARNEELEVRVADRTRSLQQSQEEILERLARAAAYKDEETGSHVKRMSEYS